MLFTFFILLLYLSPIALVYTYSKCEYRHSLRDSFKKWKISKIIGIAMFLLLSYLLMATEGSSWKLSTYWYFLWEPGLSISLIVFSKPASELLEGFSSFDYFGEDFGHIIGWLGLFSAFSWLGMVVLRLS